MLIRKAPAKSGTIWTSGHCSGRLGNYYVLYTALGCNLWVAGFISPWTGRKFSRSELKNKYLKF